MQLLLLVCLSPAVADKDAKEWNGHEKKKKAKVLKRARMTKNQ